DEDLGTGVDGARRLVEDQDGRVGEERPGDREQLLLTRADRALLVVDDGVVAVRQRVNETIDERGPSRLADLLFGGRRVAVGDVLTNRPTEEPGVLKHHPDL